MVLKEGGPAIKVRTVRPRAGGERWSAIAIKDIAATPDMPNPKDESQKGPQERTQYERLGLWCFGRAVSSKAGCETRAGLEQELQNQPWHLGEVRPTMRCKGCENKMTGDDARAHSSECRVRPEELMRGDDAEAEIIARRDRR